MNAKTLLVAMLQETGHLNPSFKLMRTLQKRGHDVRYLATPELSAYVAAQGFETVPFFPELFRDGAAASKLHVFAERRAITALPRDERAPAPGRRARLRSATRARPR